MKIASTSRYSMLSKRLNLLLEPAFRPIEILTVISMKQPVDRGEVVITACLMTYDTRVIILSH